MSAANNGGPAFPEAGLSGLPNGEFIHGQAGMTLRDYFAAKAMQAMVAMSEGHTGNVEHQIKPMVADAYAWADAMLVERAK